MTVGRFTSAKARTVVPRDNVADPDYYKPGDVVEYRLSEEELAKYRAMPKPQKEKRPMIIPGHQKRRQ